MRSAANTSARDAILAAAFRVFGEAGIEATSLREVARAAGVSPALVVHHFGGKEGLVAAVDEAAVRQFADAYAGEGGQREDDLLRRRAAQTARAMTDRPEVCAYLGRALVEGTDGSARLFAAMVAGGRAEIDVLAEAGAIRPDADRLWATLQHFLLIWAPLSFMPLLREALGGDLLAPDQLERWVEANVRLLEEGLYA
ncbi:MAG TPA: helix-turn-helix domain-containing protein [Solirubrobacterales bacterium]|nr:helix-turn-helix domain-containing protein [Solirubrobacterales bacterium]